VLAKGIVIFAHGSSVSSANHSVKAAAEEFARLGGYALVETAFLELANPTLEQAVARLVARGAREICVVPYFLTLGVHLQEDLPRLVDQIKASQPGVAIRIAAPLGGHPALVQALLERTREASN
jgi:sirohydrochlorin ferrochelatase